MAYKTIENDVLAISYRLSQIDKNYKIKYNLDKKRFEIYYRYGLKEKLELIVKSGRLDSRVLEEVRKSRTHKIDEIVKEIDLHNKKVQKEKEKNLIDEMNYKTKILCKEVI